MGVRFNIRVKDIGNIRNFKAAFHLVGKKSDFITGRLQVCLLVGGRTLASYQYPQNSKKDFAACAGKD